MGWANRPDCMECKAVGTAICFSGGPVCFPCYKKILEREKISSVVLAIKNNFTKDEIKKMLLD